MSETSQEAATDKQQHQNVTSFDQSGSVWLKLRFWWVWGAQWTNTNSCLLIISFLFVLISHFVKDAGDKRYEDPRSIFRSVCGERPNSNSEDETTEMKERGSAMHKLLPGCSTWRLLSLHITLYRLFCSAANRTLTAIWKEAALSTFHVTSPV